MEVSTRKQLKRIRGTSPGNGFSIRLFICSFVFIAVALAWLSWSTYDLYRQDAEVKSQLFINVTRAASEEPYLSEIFEGLRRL